jgi:hypothetical protein
MRRSHQQKCSGRKQLVALALVLLVGCVEARPGTFDADADAKKKAWQNCHRNGELICPCYYGGDDLCNPQESITKTAAPGTPNDNTTDVSTA